MESIGTPWTLAAFIAFILAMLGLDLGVLHRKAHRVSMREAAIWSAVWVLLALAFNAWIGWRHGADKGFEFLAGYLVEKSLSIDNIFVFVLLFGAFAVPEALQHRVLFWGVLGALVMRAAFIFAGSALLTRFGWVVARFHLLKAGLALVLIFVGAKLSLHGVVKIPILVSLGVISALIGCSVVASLLWPLRSSAVRLREETIA